MRPSGRAIRVLALTLVPLLAAACATTHERPPAAPIDKWEGPPRPPDRSELGTGPAMPRGQQLLTGLPGGDQQVNQDTSGQAQNETSVADNPTNPLNLVGAWNDYNAVDPGQNTVIGYGWTTDGGQTWQSSRVNFTTLPPDQSSGDPALAADSQGNFYLAILAYAGSADGILVARSVDGGATFQEPVRLDNGGDKPYVNVDPDTDAVYAVWYNDGGSIYFSRSTDLGLTYTPRQAISGSGSGGNGAYPVVGPLGEVYVVWGNFNDKIWFDRSLDGGDTWLDPDVLVNGDVVAPRSPLAGNFRNPEVPSMAVDRTGGPFAGRVYVIWPDQRFGDPDILIAHSDDRGDTWSAPVRVNDDVIGNDADQFFPWIDVDDNGHVHVTFLDRREDPEGLLLAMYLATSSDGGGTFGPNIRISDGIYGPSDFGFLGDYTGVAVSGDNRIHPMWPDGRFGDEDIFTRSVDLADYDDDGVLNDGDLDGQYASNRCTGGQTSLCDDNCPGDSNPDQADQDGDLVGDACDNCPADPNTDQFDVDRDGLGAECDPCPSEVGGDTGDPDDDGVANCVDNCLVTSNPDQNDADDDGIGDVCDPFPDDPDNDGVAPGGDNCEDTFNPAQLDTDDDGIGDFCDNCPGTGNADQADADGDGSGDACDCQVNDPNDRQPGDIDDLRVDRGAGGASRLSWTAPLGADAYSVTRGDLSSLSAGQYGDCSAEALLDTQFEDADLPAPGQGYFYVVQAQSFDCGLGVLGFTSDETARQNDDPGACQGGTAVDAYADGETTIDGEVTAGSFLDTQSSNDVPEEITEELRVQGPQLRYGVLEHRWNFDVSPGRRVEVHVEWYTTGEGFVLEYSSDGGANWDSIIGLGISLADDDTDRVGVLPDTLSGSVIIRTRDGEGPFIDTGFLDTLSVDELFVRSVP